MILIPNVQPLDQRELSEAALDDLIAAPVVNSLSSTPRASSPASGVRPEGTPLQSRKPSAMLFGQSRHALAKLLPVLAVIWAAAAAAAPPAARTEIFPVASVSLTNAQILSGDMKGQPVTLAGELRIPKLGDDRLAAVILVQGSNGIGPNVEAGRTI